MITLRDRIQQLADKHGGIRPAARVLKIDPSYLWRLYSGEKTEPSDAVLKKLRLVKVVTYRPK